MTNPRGTAPPDHDWSNMPTTTTARAALFATGMAVGLALGIPAGGWLATESMPDDVTVPAHTVAAPAEDDPGWSCVDSGNHICGPLSDDFGHTPGCYDDGGVFVAPWPCHVVVNPQTGEGDVYTGLA
ncbi:hypothetical protein SEA_FUNSIZED_64 [Mycobacterium phage Funsized]|nr:hypothetical protein SEA_FUNSIZED_64 [Mycobacterium phage Funsized]